jgi:hypothetical protein
VIPPHRKLIRTHIISDFDLIENMMVLQQDKKHKLYCMFGHVVTATSEEEAKPD